MRALLSALLMVLSTTAWADFQFLPATATAAPRFYFSGYITEADGQEFIKAFQSLQSMNGALIQLESDGGEAIGSLDIADIVRRSGLHTWVPDDKICASACSMIWIAGGAKYAGRRAHIGFHGAYNGRTGQQMPIALAMQGALLGRLDYSYGAIYWMVSPQALDMNWLTPEIADKLGIYFEYDKTFPPGPPRALYAYAPPAPKPEPQPAAKFHWRVIENLNLRVSPDPRSANVLSQWSPKDFIPEGTTIYGNSLPRCVPGPTGYIWCDITFGHHGTATHGWVAGYYLWSLEESRRVACLYPNPDPDCSRK
jgi:hypothetical protein